MRFLPTTIFGSLQHTLLLICTCCYGCGDGTSIFVEEPERQRVDTGGLRVHVIKPRFTENAAKTVVCYGKFRPVTESRLRFGRPGVVAKLLKKVGDEVVEGELLAELEQGELKSQVSQLEIRLQEAKDRLRTLPPSGAAQQTIQIQQLQGQLTELRAQLEVGRLTAKTTGLLVKSNLRVDSVAVPSRSVMIVADKTSPVVDISLNSQTAADLEDSQSIWVGHNGALITSIQSRKAIPGENGAERITLKFEEPLDADSWEYDSVVEVRYLKLQDESGYWIPMTALNRSPDGAWSILVVDASVGDATPSELRRQTCEVIRHQNEQVLVTPTKLTSANLNAANLTSANLANDLIVVDGSHRVVAGQSVVAVVLPDTGSGNSRPTGDR